MTTVLDLFASEVGGVGVMSRDRLNFHDPCKKGSVQQGLKHRRMC